MYPTTLQKWERSGWAYTIEEFQGRYRVYGGVHDGMKWQYNVEGAKYGYKTLTMATKVYNQKVAQTDAMLTKQGR